MVGAGLKEFRSGSGFAGWTGMLAILNRWWSRLQRILVVEGGNSLTGVV